LKFLTPFNFIKFTLFFSFLLPFLTYVFSIIIGYKFPYFGDFFLLISFSFFSGINFKNFKFNKLDTLIFLYLILVILFIFINQFYFWTLFRVSEIRYIIYIPILYFFFRISFSTARTSFEVLDMIYLIMKINLFICIIEFFLINFFPFSDALLNRALMIYVDKDRIYDPIFGNLYKPLGLFPGSGNASIGISIFMIWATKVKKSSWFFHVSIIFGLVITLTLTSLIVMILGVLFILNKKIKVYNFFVYSIILFLMIYYSAQITNLRSSGALSSDLEKVSFENASLVYQISYEKYLESFSFYPHIFTYNESYNLQDLIGPTGEIYLLRVGIYFGNFVLFIFIFWLGYLIFLSLKSNNVHSKILYFISFSLIISSFHYPAINGIPLYILLPLSCVLGLNIDKVANY
jgi:hypothetical protein